MKYLNHISFFSLSPGIRLRREYFGGLVYDRRNGNILETDKDAFKLLSYLRNGCLNIGKTLRYLTENKIIKKSGKQVGKTINKLMAFGIIRRANDVPAPLSSLTFSENKLDQVLKPWLSAPETIHWAITYRCNENCQDCYVRRFSFNKSEISTDGAQRLIDRIADWDVFQLAIGGGEPF